MTPFHKELIRHLLFPMVLVGAVGGGFLLADQQMLNEGTALGVNIVVLLLAAGFERILPWQADWNRSRGDSWTDTHS
jgi:hypothetical protein